MDEGYFSVSISGADNRSRTCTVAHQILSLARLPIPPYPRSDLRVFARKSELSPWDYLFMPSATATAQATVAPTIGLLPMRHDRNSMSFISNRMTYYIEPFKENQGNPDVISRSMILENYIKLRAISLRWTNGGQGQALSTRI